MTRNIQPISRKRNKARLKSLKKTKQKCIVESPKMGNNWRPQGLTAQAYHYKNMKDIYKAEINEKQTYYCIRKNGSIIYGGSLEDNIEDKQDYVLKKLNEIKNNNIE